MTKSNEKDVVDYYERYWTKFVQWWKADKTLGIHLPYYEKGVKTFEEAILNTNDFVGRLLGLDTKKSMRILDAGCGVGGTSIYLAQKYPNVKFSGITISPGQIKLANKFAKERHVNNVRFEVNNYIDTSFPDNYFDAVFALESISYAKDKRDFIHEMYRILKPGSRLVIIDGFFIGIPLNFFIKKIFKMWCEGRAVPTNADHSLPNLILNLKRGRFKEINVMNLSKNVRRSALRSLIIGIPFFISSMFKRIIKYGKYKPVEDANYFLGVSVFTFLLGLSGGFKYFAVTVVKS